MIRAFFRRIESTTDRRLVAIMVGVFAVVHAIYYILAGIRPDTEAQEWSWVLLDLNFLKNDLLRSVFYTHMHPPVINLFVGVIRKLSPGHEKLAFGTIYVLLGLGFYLAVYFLMRQFKISKVLSLVLSTLFMISPSFILEEQLISYDWLLVPTLTISAVLLYFYLERRRWWVLFLFFVLIGLMCSTRSIFHLLYFVVVFSVVLVAVKDPKTVITAALVPFLIVLSIYVKNFVLFHHFAAGSGMGFNISKVLIRSTSLEERKRWVAEGVVSEIFLIEPAYPLSLFPKKYLEAKGYENIPALRQPIKRDSVSQNLNHMGYLALSDDYTRESINAILHYPRAEMFGLMSAWYCYFRSPAENIVLEPNRSRIAPMVNLYDYVFFGKFPWQVPFGKGYNLYVFLLIGLPLLYLYGVRLVLRPGSKSGLDGTQRLVALYMIANIAYITFLTNTLELAENQRGQFYTLAFVLVFLGVFLERVIARRKNRPGVVKVA